MSRFFANLCLGGAFSEPKIRRKNSAPHSFAIGILEIFPDTVISYVPFMYPSRYYLADSADLTENDSPVTRTCSQQEIACYPR